MTEESLPENGLEAAVADSNAETKTEDRTITVRGKKFGLIPKLSVPVTYAITKAQREDDLSLLVEAFVKIVNPSQRTDFLEHILAEPENDSDEPELDLDDFSDLVGEALEKVAGRPLEQ